MGAVWPDKQQANFANTVRGIENNQLDFIQCFQMVI